MSRLWRVVLVREADEVSDQIHPAPRLLPCRDEGETLLTHAQGHLRPTLTTICTAPLPPSSPVLVLTRREQLPGGPVVRSRWPSIPPLQLDAFCLCPLRRTASSPNRTIFSGLLISIHQLQESCLLCKSVGCTVDVVLHSYFDVHTCDVYLVNVASWWPCCVAGHDRLSHLLSSHVDK